MSSCCKTRSTSTRRTVRAFAFSSFPCPPTSPFQLFSRPRTDAKNTPNHLPVSKFDYVRRALKVDDADEGALSGINVEASGIGRVLKTIEKGKQDKAEVLRVVPLTDRLLLRSVSD